VTVFPLSPKKNHLIKNIEKRRRKAKEEKYSATHSRRLLSVHYRCHTGKKLAVRKEGKRKTKKKASATNDTVKTDAAKDRPGERR